jgi:hypothetical protein
MTRKVTRWLSSALGAVAGVALLSAASQLTGCNFAAGVRSNPSAGATGSSGSAGATGGDAAAGAAPWDAASPFDFGGAYLNHDAGDATGSGPCENLGCQQSTCYGAGCTVTCPAGQRTTVSGTIYDPAGAVPLYNVTVYVPNAALADIDDGPSCDPCNPNTGTSLLSGKPIVFTKTDTSGRFTLGKTLGDVPAGENVPLVIQIGKWRRQVTLPSVKPCVDNPITDTSLSRLPRTSAEGHIPKIALTTGGSDAMECLLRKIGIADTEFTSDAGKGRVNLFAGGGGTSSFAPGAGDGVAFTPANPWWDSLDNLKKYDIVLHSCEGSQGEYGTTNNPGDPMSVKSPAARMALQQFADLGGRVFASHWHTYWFEKGTPAFMSIGTFNHNPALGRSYDATIDQSFPTGSALAQWMVNVSGSTTLGMVTIAQDANARLIDAAAGPPTSQRWIYASTLKPQSVQFLSATTPIPAGTCGRAVISDLHVSAGGNGSDAPNKPFPSGCINPTMSPREKVLEFMLFDIASCVAPVVQ